MKKNGSKDYPFFKFSRTTPPSLSEIVARPPSTGGAPHKAACLLRPTSLLTGSAKQPLLSLSFCLGAMLGIANRLLRVATSSPSRSDAAGHGGLVSLVYAGAVLVEIILCVIIIARIACETCRSLPALSRHDTISVLHAG